MISALIAYSKTVIGFLLFAVLAELFLPGEKWKRYSRLVLGLLLIAALASSIKDVLKGNTVHVPETETAVEAATTAEDPMVLEVYETQMGTYLMENLQVPGYRVTEAAVTAQTDGSLEKVTLTVEPQQEETGLVTPVSAFAGSEGPDEAKVTAALEALGLSVESLEIQRR